MRQYIVTRKRTDTAVHCRGEESCRRAALRAVLQAHGAFYIYIDLGRFGVTDSAALSAALLEEARWIAVQYMRP